MYVSFAALWILLATRHSAYRCKILNKEIEHDKEDIRILETLKEECVAFEDMIKKSESVTVLRDETEKFITTYCNKRHTLSKRTKYFDVKLPSLLRHNIDWYLPQRALGLENYKERLQRGLVKDFLETYAVMIEGCNYIIDTRKKLHEKNQKSWW